MQKFDHNIVFLEKAIFWPKLKTSTPENGEKTFSILHPLWH
jgi:hypothetical protein